MLPLSNTAIHLTRHRSFTVPLSVYSYGSLRAGDSER
jgi:hypothetical protein